MILETSRLLLKSPQAVTGQAVLAYYLRNREFLREFTPLREADFYTAAHQCRLLADAEQNWQTGTGFRFYLCRKELPEEIIGTIALSNIVRGAFQSCFLGYQLDQNHLRQGYMTEAVHRIVAFAFDDLQLHRIEANILPRNIPSRGVAKKCHFEMEGISPKYLKINGIWEDHIHYVIRNNTMEQEKELSPQG